MDEKTLAEENEAMRRALENVRMLAMRLRRTEPENAAHFLRFCAEVGVTGSVLRSEAAPTMEGKVLSPPGAAIRMVAWGKRKRPKPAGPYR